MRTKCTMCGEKIEGDKDDVCLICATKIFEKMLKMTRIKIENQHKHDFQYSHIEHDTSNWTFAMNPKKKEIVVCRGCGEIKKTPWT